MEFNELQQLFDDAKQITFLTGAGVSTPSGIPDYRSKGGLYTTDKTDKPAEYYLSHDCLVNEPEVFYQYVMNNMYYPNAQPNVIQKKQSILTRQNRASIVTQNVDNLYEKADARHLNEFHGNLYDIYCQKCGKHVDYQTYAQSMYHQNCGGILRPNIVLYGEGINQETVIKSVQAVQNADLLVVVGSSMRVYPFAGLLDYRNPEAKILVINQEKLALPGDFIMQQMDAVDFFDKLKV
ncbi:NAD-dependent protein deacylase [Fructilactobacillus lindneri]|uniref:protein acetyllysine N-acetyltransferase n=2 Tax=Fructilactobacillus lindneri TaxID=53444 RepID=A0A0R2K3K5_9LACO|nr:NAD-dependent protein deacylase [Fructilactobacillus lindneri]ANZ57356.1 NAD-dependent protein deacylase [Fructilactobacillus lindneri]ANZ58621.1 NAD-dependent protein deacylase [Fructilactobacillus lindneri]KRN80708.1 NAD-dependent deacetylase [Fructilactobacillus lindneri DSM 20690 = JCM 11027]POG97659.1 NAD-dependent protein deacylase [Fructilactobacillus lindneri]POG98996.1 NAD-dependent protein deacylase [Fructilactobacillus lindneri]